MKHTYRLTGLVLTLSLVMTGVARPRTDIQVANVITEYFDLLRSGNIEIAGDMWTPEALERSSRFGISYTGIPLKVDAVSPFIRHLNSRSWEPIAPIKNYQSLPGDNWFKLEYQEVFGSELANHYYYVQQRGDWYWLGYPQDYYAADWPVVETEFFRIHAHPDVRKYLNPAALDAADAFVRAMADTLGIPEDRLSQIGRRKIEYFYCPSESVFTDITGHRGKGMLDLASNDIISANFPHFHELTHLLVNIRLQKVSLFTLPLFREGVAVRYGGRWGKKASALLDLAVFLYREDFVSLDSLLTMSGFESESTADLVYPVAGLFSSFMIDEKGLDNYFGLYSRFSGGLDELKALSPDEVKTEIAAVMDVDSWVRVKEAFDDYLVNRLDERLGMLPGDVDGGKKIFNKDGVLIDEDKQWIGFRFSYDTTMRAPSGAFLFAPDKGLTDHLSSLFESHYEGTEMFEGYRYAIRYDGNEAGLYDYATNQLVAKYIWGITPSDAYLDSTAHTISLKLRKSLLDGHLPSKGEYRLLPW